MTLPTQLLFTVLLAGFISYGLAWMQVSADDRRDATARELSIQQLADQEVLANVQFIRETVRDSPDGLKNFRGMNLRGANLSGIDVGCDLTVEELDDEMRALIAAEPQYASFGAVVPELIRPAEPSSCADFTGSDMTGANLYNANLTGAILNDVALTDSDLVNLAAPGARFLRTELGGAQFGGSDLRGSVFLGVERVVLDGVSSQGVSVDFPSAVGIDCTSVATEQCQWYQDRFDAHGYVGCTETVCVPHMNTSALLSEEEWTAYDGAVSEAAVRISETWTALRE